MNIVEKFKQPTEKPKNTPKTSIFFRFRRRPNPLKPPQFEPKQTSKHLYNTRFNPESALIFEIPQTDSSKTFSLRSFKIKTGHINSLLFQKVSSENLMIKIKDVIRGPELHMSCQMRISHPNLCRIDTGTMPKNVKSM